MKLLQRHEFINGKAFETALLSPDDTKHLRVPECDVIAFSRVDENGISTAIVMRPDEALIQARMLMDAVRLITGEYYIELAQPENDEIDDDPQPRQEN